MLQWEDKNQAFSEEFKNISGEIEKTGSPFFSGGNLKGIYWTGRFKIWEYPVVFKYINEVERIRGKKLKIMDFGCGVTPFAQYLTKFGHEVWGVDWKFTHNTQPTIQMLNREYPDVKYYIGNVDNLMEDNFDIIFSCSVLEHIHPTSVLLRVLDTLRFKLNKAGKMLHVVDYYLRGRKNIDFNRVMKHLDIDFDPKRCPGSDVFELGSIRDNFIYPNKEQIGLRFPQARLLFGDNIDTSPLNDGPVTVVVPKTKDLLSISHKAPIKIGIFALARSGHHSILNSIAKQADGNVRHFNGCNKRLQQANKKDPRYCRLYRNVDKDEVKYNIYSIENFDLRGFKECFAGVFDKVLLVNRDPYNWIASSLKMKKGLDKNCRIEETWKQEGYLDWWCNTMSRYDMCFQYLRQALKYEDLIGQDYIDISYNRWVADAEYRKSIVTGLGFVFTDDGIDDVLDFGIGSSFDKLSFRKRGSSMNTLGRWKEYSGDSKWLNLVSHSELQKLSQEYFDFCPVNMNIYNRKKLVAGPWVGEFGWELCVWVPYLRNLYQSGQYSEIIVASRSSSEFLYSDFVSKYIPYDSNDQNCSYTGTGEICDTRDKYQKRKKIAEDIFSNLEWDEMIVPYKDDIINHRKVFLPYGNVNSNLSYDVVLHARHIWDVGKGLVSKKDRNWKKEKWDKLGQLLKEHNIKACSIGTRSAALHVPHTEDKRGEGLHIVTDILRNSKLCVGPSSGPMHLAALCKCPHLVWTQRSNVPRYNFKWNPFLTKVKLMLDGDSNGWNPKVNSVFENILIELGLKRNIL